MSEGKGGSPYFDDITIVHSKGPVVQADSYSPFGLTFNSFRRDELQPEGTYTKNGLGRKDLGFRAYEPALGRFHSVDPLAELQESESTYHYAGNNPVNNQDILGLLSENADDGIFDIFKKDKVKEHKRNKERTARSTQRQGASGNRRGVKLPGQNNNTAKNDRGSRKPKDRGESQGNKTDSNNQVASTGQSGNHGEKDSASDDPFAMDHTEEPISKWLAGERQPDNPWNRPAASGSTTATSQLGNPHNLVPSTTRSPGSSTSTLDHWVQQAAQTEDLEEARQELFRNLPYDVALSIYNLTLLTKDDESIYSSALQDAVSTLSQPGIGDAGDELIESINEIRCSTCPSGWEDLIHFKPSQSVYKKFNKENAYLFSQMGAYAPKWYVHDIENARGSKINLDLYSATINTLPIINGQQMTIDELFHYVRKNMNDFFDNDVATFGHYPNEQNMTNGQNWETSNYHEVVMMFRAYLEGTFFFDDLAVISSQTENGWIFSTIHTPYTNNHAVSGNRQFGYISNLDGTFTIFTRGADVATGYIDVMAGERIFEGGDTLWRSLISNIVLFVEQHSGDTGLVTITSNRYELD
jgi:RHS repeat-associated protein